MKALRISVLAIAATAGCNSSQPSSTNDSGPPSVDATTAEAGDDSATAPDAEEEATTPCVDTEGGATPSDDCLLLGQCPLGCVHGTASAYACAPGDSGAGTYPSTFVPPADPVHVIEYVPGAGPWDAGAYVSCAPLACVRWSLADNGASGSAWPGDPCSDPDAADATQAWVCPAYQGFQPEGPGCFNAGPSQQVGGAGTGMMTNVVWCCPPPFEEAGAESGPPVEASTGDASGATEAGSEGGTDATSE
jgi:hypothetical protein